MPILVNTLNYHDGSSTESKTLDETYAALKERDDVNAFVGISDPTNDDMHALTSHFGMNELAVEDSTEGHQRAKLDRYGHTYFLVLRPAVYLDKEEEIHFGEIHLFMGENFMVAIVKDYLRKESNVKALLEDIASKIENLKTPWDMVHAALDSVVDRYFPVVEGLENDSDEIEDALFSPMPTDTAGVSQRIYALLNEIADFKRACKPLLGMLDTLMERIRATADTDNPEDKQEAIHDVRQFRDVKDHAIQINDRIDDLRSTLQNALEVNSILVAEQQNDDMKRISAWAAILVAPTIIGSIYGMNFENMPELQWPWGYPASLLLMVAVSTILYLVFKRKNWM
ncbi:magnesium and cobalt transport protein CorA [Rothia amarae]|uniref:Magnesium and cobalt transport protein CorA n=1 Tax=Rothia amarae TaxID=169480 RepID=A0A7H2BJ93_9MICC|nr:magnesium and cobalt transport protein CorA [Rothia amarae]QNV39739.1 magnesium and cobalt transport protein CorA [Rothia amarae]